MRWRAALFALLFMLPLGAAALEPEERLEDPALEARARALSAGLRCVVCQNQSIDESNAEMAADMRLVVRERLKAGDSDEDVRRYLVDRYGDYVLLRPPVGPHTIALWAAPAVLILAGGLVLAFALTRRRAAVAKAAPLSEEERQRLGRALSGSRPPGPPPDRPAPD